MKSRQLWLLATLSLAPLYLTEPVSAAGQVPACAVGGADFCGFDRPEDLAALPGTRWLAVSQSSLTAPIVLLNLRTGARRSYDPSARHNPPPRSARGCSGPPDHIDAGGIDARRVHGQVWLAALNRSTPQRIELLVVNGLLAEPTMVWRDCVPVPSAYAINDVALTPNGDLYATHMFDRPESPAAAQQLRAKFLAKLGWAKVAGSDLSFANGIAVSGDGRWLAVSGTFDQALLIVNLTHHDIRRLPVPLQPDNLTPLGRASIIVAGHTGVPVSGVDPCRDPRAKPCGFPFAVVKLTAKTGEVAPIYTDTGAATPGASVGLLDGQLLYLGSAFGDRVSIRRPKT
jgi:hypothetical protein